MEKPISRCECLRSKDMLLDAIWDPSVQRGNDQLFWCQKTQICLGPDGKLADDCECSPARDCYREL